MKPTGLPFFHFAPEYQFSLIFWEYQVLVWAYQVNESSFVIPNELLPLNSILWKPSFCFLIDSNLSSFKTTGGESGTKTSCLVNFMVSTVPQNQLKLVEPIFHWWDALEVLLLVFSLRAKSHIRSFNDMFMTCSCLFHNLFKNSAWLVHNLFVTCSLFVHDLFIFCLRLVHD